jgi:hypothetical protein
MIDRLVAAMRPNDLTNVCDTSSLVESLQRLELGRLADLVDNEALRSRIANRDAALDRLRREPYADTGMQFELARLMLQQAPSPPLKPSRPTRRKPAKRQSRKRSGR